ncbi:MAG: PorV/PorQ family protein [Gemmatimonadota bacterium]|nr:PorV/PorQ family protein [Gemmatimonadota bacterium]
MHSPLRRALLGAAALGVFTFGAVQAQEVPLPGIDNTAFGGSSAEFLLLGAGARGAALGSSFAAIATDATALYWNPAGVAEMARPGLSISMYDYVADTRYSWGGIAFPFNDGQTAIGFQMGTFGFSDQPIYSLAAPEGDGSTYDVSQSFMGITVAQNFSDRFSAGLTGKFLNDRLGKAKATGVAFDFGTSFHALVAERPIRASFVVANLGSTLRHTGVGLDIIVDRPAPPNQDQVPQDPAPARYTSEEFGLPVAFRVALAYDFIASQASRLTLLGAFAQPNNTSASGGGGFEWAITDISSSGFTVMARGSYMYQADNNFVPTGAAGFSTDAWATEDLDGLALGGGIAYARGTFSLGLDYAYQYMGLLGGTNVFSASLTW